jgi:hypothetical protein
VHKTSGSTDLDQDRSHNEVNEVTDITETTGAAWPMPVHDAAWQVLETRRTTPGTKSPRKPSRLAGDS